VASGDELAGKELAPADSLTDALHDLLGALVPSSERIAGSLEGAKAVASAERQLDVDLTYKGLAGAVVRAKVTGSDRKPVPAVACQEVPVPEGDAAAARHLTVSCSLQANAPEGQVATSTYLLFEVAKAGRSVAQIVRAFALPKTWKQAVAPENVIVDITPRALGRTADYVRALSAPVPLPTPTPRPVVIVRDHRTPLPVMRIGLLPERPADVALRIDHSVALRATTAEVTEALPNSRIRVPIRDFTFVKPEPTTPATPTAPTNKVSAFTIDLLNGVDTAGVDVARDEVLRVFETVYRDENAESGVFYFIPRGYRLAWDETIGGSRGLGLRMSYQRLSGGSADNSVRTALTLDAGVDLVEQSVARELLAVQSRQAPAFKFTELRAFPLAAPPLISLRDDLQHAYNISGDRIAVVALTDALGQIDVSWTTDTVNTQNMRLALRQGLGLGGEISFSPVNAGGPSPVIPIRVRIDDPETYGTIAWSRGELRNRTPFPLRLETLHALVVDGTRASVYSWDLGAAAVPPRARIRFALDQLPEAVDRAAKRMWIRYSLDRRCETCVSDVIDQLLSGDVWPDISRVTVRTLTPLADTGAAELWVKTRSRFFTTAASEVTPGPTLTFTADRSEQVVEPVFGRPAPDDVPDAPPLLEYLITLIMPDGTEHRGTTWIPSPSDQIRVGRVQVEKSLGALPPHP
jgi:hypothetical protein